MQGRTTIFISHRISTVRHADKLRCWLLDRLRNLEPTSSFGRNGYYASLFQKQQLEEELAVTH